jgi:hypothetical protein
MYLNLDSFNANIKPNFFKNYLIPARKSIDLQIQSGAKSKKRSIGLNLFENSCVFKKKC